MNNTNKPVDLPTNPDHPDVDLVESLENLVEHNQAVGVEVRYKVYGEPRRVPPQIELVLYRAVEEGLTNVRKHADASRVLLDLEFLSVNIRVLLQDNGRGAANPDNETDTVGSGLLDLREQVRLLGGQMLIDTELGEGFNLVIEVPG